MKSIKFNNISSKDLGIVIQHSPTYTYPERDVETVHVPGRNGDLVIDNKCFKNTIRSYNCALVYNSEIDYIKGSDIINNWLHSSGADYAKLEDDYDPGVYRLARYSESNSITDVYQGASVFNINFECKPQRFMIKGEEPITYTTTNITIANESVYDSKPLIQISGIQQDIDKILLMSVINYNLDVTSTITIKSEDQDIYIDSDKQSCYNGLGEDINYKIGLNGKDFPHFEKGDTNIKIESYEQDSIIISPYNNIIAENQTICKSEYKSKDNLIAEQEDDIFIKSYKSLISSKQKNFFGQAYQSFVTEQCEKNIYAHDGTILAGSYTFSSINTIFDSIARQFSIYGTLSENPDISGSGNGYIRATQNDDTLTIYATKKGYFMTSLDKYICLFDVDSVIATIKTTSSLNINYYEIDSNDEIDIIYDDLPDWLKFEIEYSTVENKKYPNRILYKTNKSGSFWLDKKTLFGKPKWKYLDANELLEDLKWSNSKKAFMPTQGITTSTTKSSTFRYISRTIQYSEVVSSETETYIKVVRSSDIPSGSDDLVRIKLVTDRAGYYSYQLNDNSSTKTSWRYYDAENRDIVVINGTDSFEIFYLESIPDYSDEEDWPDWLYPYIIAEDPLNAVFVKYKIKKNALYRYSYMDSSVEKYTDWEQHNAEDILEFSTHRKTSDESFHLSMIERLPDEYPNDRAYTIDSSDPSEYPPEWLSVDISPVSDENPDGLINYTVNTNGYFKFDSNSVWQYKTVGETLLSTGLKDDTIFYYMNELPAYPDIYDNIALTVYEDNYGNPSNVDITVVENGYYRINYNSDWVYYKNGDLLYSATTSEETKVNYLKQIEDNSLNSLSITIIPRWWLL